MWLQFLSISFCLFQIIPTSHAAEDYSAQENRAIINTCPNFPKFVHWIKRQCPMILDLRCVVGLPVDVPAPHGMLNCATVDDLEESSLNIVNAWTLLELVQRKDPFGRPWCMLSLFYSPNCVFSAKVAESFHRVSPLFPKLLVVAMDVSSPTREVESLVSHFGIASTPVMALWEGGVPRYRLYDDYSKLENLVKVIQSRTDLRKQHQPPPIADENKQEVSQAGILGINIADPQQSPANNKTLQISLEEFLKQFKYLKKDLGFDWYFLAASITLVINTLYFVLNSPKALDLIRRCYARFHV